MCFFIKVTDEEVGAGRAAASVTLFIIILLLLSNNINIFIYHSVSESLSSPNLLFFFLITFCFCLIYFYIFIYLLHTIVMLQSIAVNSSLSESINDLYRRAEKDALPLPAALLKRAELSPSHVTPTGAPLQP